MLGVSQSQRRLTPPSRRQPTAGRATAVAHSCLRAACCRLRLMSNVRHHSTPVVQASILSGDEAQSSARRARLPAGSPSAWLLGTWRSDKQATVHAWGKYPPGSPAYQRILEESLGILVNRYTAKRSYSKTSDWESVVPYRVLWENADSLLLVYGRRGDERGELISFASPTQYWVHVGRYWEFFTKQGGA